jgi:hypothetical protein
MNTSTNPRFGWIGAQAAALLAPVGSAVRSLSRGYRDFDFSRPFPQERPGFRRSLRRLQAGKLIEKARIRVVTEGGAMIRFYGADGTEYEGIALFADMEHELKEIICSGVDVNVIVIQSIDRRFGIPLLEIVTPTATVAA